MCQLFVSGGQAVGASASVLVLAMNIQGEFPLGLTDLISLLSKGLSSLLCKVQFQRGRKGQTTSTEVGYLYSGKEGRQSA